MSEPITFVHLTDLHVGNPAVQDDHLYSDTSATLARILAEIKLLQPQPKFIVASGDLTNRSDADSYEQLRPQCLVSRQYRCRSVRGSDTEDGTRFCDK
jgi:Icc protein